MTRLPDTSTEQGQREASVMLARLMGWTTKFYGNSNQSDKHDRYGLYDQHGEFIRRCDVWRGNDPMARILPNLYDPANMALAWRVLNWAQTPNDLNASVTDLARAEMLIAFNMLPKMPPADAQRVWLDKILSLALEAGMIEAQP